MNTPLPAWLEAFRRRHDAEVIETHISWLLLGPAQVWKIKKPLHLPFLDYGCAARRRTCCEEELRLNRQFAPTLYLGIAPVGRSDDGDEWAVVMRRFPEAQRADHLCAAGTLGLDAIAGLAAAVHAFHARTAVAGGDSPFGEPDAVLAQALDNFRDLAPLAPHEHTRLHALDTWTRREFAAIRPTLAARKAGGKVRECHGDLHLGNLVILDGVITPFDCIEFNPELRWIDVASEIAFTYIDLLDHRQPALAAWLLDAWLTASGDFEALKVLRFYAVYRALVRAKVAALGGDSAGIETYLALASALSRPPGPTLTITFGLSGSGKTTRSAARLRADPAANTVRLRSDVERKRLFGLAPLADSHAAVAGGIYTREATLRTYTLLRDTAGMLLDDGWSVVIDAAFLKREERNAFRALARDRRVPFGILACHAPPDELRRRLAARRGDASEATAAVLDSQLRWVEPLGGDEQALVVPD